MKGVSLSKLLTAASVVSGFLGLCSVMFDTLKDGGFGVLLGTCALSEQPHGDSVCLAGISPESGAAHPSAMEYLWEVLIIFSAALQ